jgi:hypothetical protein
MGESGRASSERRRPQEAVSRADGFIPVISDRSRQDALEILEAPMDSQRFDPNIELKVTKDRTTVSIGKHTTSGAWA